MHRFPLTFFIFLIPGIDFLVSVFLFPPSQDSVLLVTAEAYATCNTANPIWSSNTGNSVFNINTTGVYYFISGVPNNCRSNEKLQVCVPSNGTCATYTAPLPLLSPASAPAPAPSQLRSTSSAPSFSPSWSPSFPPPSWSPKSSPSYSALSPMIRSWSSMISRPIVVVSATLGLLVWASVMEWIGGWRTESIYWDDFYSLLLQFIWFFSQYVLLPLRFGFCNFKSICLYTFF